MTMGRTIVCYPAAFAAFLVSIGLLYPVSAVEMLNVTSHGEVGKPASVSCSVYPEGAIVKWLFQDKLVEKNDRINIIETKGAKDKDIDGTKAITKISTITITNAKASDSGNYTCLAQVGDDEGTKNSSKVVLDLSFPAVWIENATPTRFDVNVSDSATVSASCVFEAYNIQQVMLYKQDGGGGVKSVTPTPVENHPKRIRVNFDIPIHRPEDNGTYVCEINDTVTKKTVQGKVDVVVKALPKVTIDMAQGISTTQIYLNWTVFKYNSEIKTYHLHYRKEDTNTSMLYTARRIMPQNTSFVMTGLLKATKYDLVLEVVTEYGASKSELYKGVSTLDYDPDFVPRISINGFSATSVTIGWLPPDDKLAPYIHYYILEAKKKDENVPRTAYHSSDGHTLPYMFDYLEPHSTYIFKVRACSEYTGQCFNWSEEMEAATLDGNPTKPTDLNLYCSSTFINLTWGPPERPNAEIKGYTMELTGKATFRDRYGKEKEVTWGPLSKFTTNVTKSVRFDDLQPNTNYTVRLSAMTRTRRRGDEATAACPTRPAPPALPPRPRWRKILQDDKYMFKMYLPRISERNGIICCYRVYMVRLPPNWDLRNLPIPKDIKVLEHKDAHSQSPAVGAYITDIFSNNNFPFESELVMGDEKSQFNASESTFRLSACTRCLEKRPRDEPTTTTTTTQLPTTTQADADPDFNTEDDLDENIRDKRSYEVPERDYGQDQTMANKVVPSIELDDLANDGQLDSNANYTSFVELISGVEGEPSMYSEYVNVLMPAPTPPAPQPISAIEIALRVTCGVAAFVLLLMIVFCIRQTRRSRKLPPHAPLEMNSLQAAFRNIFRSRGAHTPAAPPDMPPIAKEELAAAYAERQLDSDYGFQKEFEMLPDCFPDRTTHASEARENQPKNRYPDIKAYDQTRVKLTPVDGVSGSDYINANYVMGYQDRKQFICAQGPTDTTINDFWRMIWENGLELIVMLTNLEEYSKVKCSKYWPDEVKGSRAFGALTVHHVTEKRYSDYIVRELKISKQPLNSEGQPIVENNGIAKRNGDCKEASEGSAPTSPREGKEAECRTVRQYHFLMWKDFAAPEHAYSILKFIKRVNEAWGSTLGRACVVHCSAGVGRTGTLVALDCLLEQLRDTRHAAVFNTVAELRRARNFLVQSLKQYVFVYRALVEYAHFDDTEIPAHKLKSSIDALRNTPPNAATSLMEIEFEKILNCPIPEPIKSCAAGAAEELRPKNRSMEILPYDRNRVILAPIPGRDFSTYINASFIEAYDNSESFIITQDPLPGTIMDFWRMVAEHNVTTIVMLSEMGEGKCPRYWEDGTSQYEHICVQYEESESCPYYTRRQFRLTNNKSGCVACVRQLQYQGWPTAPGSVPEVTRGLADLADAASLASSASSASPASPAHGAMLVHCNLGTERSALFVALCILICQLRTERRVDVCCVARKLRSQRTRTINAFLQYEFLHRAILNYAELHNLLEDS